MSLNLESAVGSLQRIVSLLHLNQDDARAYATTIVEAVGWMQPFRFEEVCKQLVTEMNTNRRPVPAQYIAIYKKLEERKGWKRPETKKCSGCCGEYFIPTWIWHERFDRAYTAVKPCPMCSSLRDLPMADGIEEIRKEDYEAWRQEQLDKVKASTFTISKAALSSVATAGMATTLPAIMDDEAPPEE